MTGTQCTRTVHMHPPFNWDLLPMLVLTTSMKSLKNKGKIP